ncbi:MAG: AMP-binding protein, partial [Pseudonocardiaceae bacterium]
MSPSSSAPACVGRNVADLVSEAAARGQAHPALIESVSGRELSWGQLDAAVDAEAARLVAHGLQPGQRVVLRMPTSAAFCVSLFAVLRAGGVAVPVGRGAAGRELGRVLDSCAAGLLVAAPDDTTAEEAAGRAGVTRLDPPADNTTEPAATEPAATEPAATEPAATEPAATEPAATEPAATEPAATEPAGAATEPPTGGEDLAVLAFTSGTSGDPRGVMLSHRALLA